MATHALFVDKSGNVLLDFSPLTSSGVTIPQGCVLVRVCNDDYKYSFSGSLGQLIEITNNQYTTIGNLFRYNGTYDYVDYDLLQFQGQTINFYNHSNLFNSVPHDAGTDIYDFSMYSGGGSSGGDIDFSTIVTALNSIATALSALTNLSNLSNLAQLANIITAIQNKDNQSDIVEELRYIFTQNMSQNAYRQLDNVYNLSIFKSNYSASELSNLSRLGSVSVYTLFRHFASLFSQVNYSVSNPDAFSSQNNKTLQRILRCFTTALSSDDFSAVSEKSFLSIIETKLEQNLPFVTNVYPLVETNVDFPYEVKILNKDNCSDNKKNDI